MHPLVRDLYKRAILIGRDYPHPEGLDYVRRVWKTALRDPRNCPSCYVLSPSSTVDFGAGVGGGARAGSEAGGDGDGGGDGGQEPSLLDSISTEMTPMPSDADACEREIRRAVARGRHMVREMEGVVRLKKYRVMKRRYGGDWE